MNPAKASQNRRSLYVVAGYVLIALAMAGCAGSMSGRATRGAVGEMRAQSETGRPLPEMAGNAVEGAVQALNEPEQLARIRAVVAAASTEAVTRALEAAISKGQPGEHSLLEQASVQAADA